MEKTVRLEQVVNSRILTMISILVTLNLLGQDKIEGKYCLDYDLKIYSECIILYEDYTFDMTFGEHINKKSKLQGMWTYTNTILKLNFKEPHYNDSYKILVSESNNESDSVRVNFQIKDFKSGPMLGVNLIIKQKGVTLETDANGSLELFFKKNDSILYGYTEYLGYHNSYFSFDLKSNKMIEIYIDEFDINELKYGDNLKLEYGQNSLYMINENGKKIKWVKNK
ncbi:hypothetical protein ACFQ0R_04980 [Psychroflexus salinarum]|uniref:Lipocalin-like domain-containing protein n=1 Tax=Psychroflexus salinarum TaxID=546024 RepID=A0ABW3GQ77_9FLAO